MNNYRLPRNRVKDYTSRPLMHDITSRKDTFNNQRTDIRYRFRGYSQKDNRQTIAQSESSDDTKVEAVSAKPSAVSKNLLLHKWSQIALVSSKKLLKNKRIVYSLSISLVIVAVLLNVVNIVTKSELLPGAQAQGVESTNSDATNKDEATNSLADVDETEPKNDTIRSYRVADNLPRFLTIGSIGVYTKVLPVGLSSNNEILTPKNIYNVGWYQGSSKPGQRGAIFINGHVSGPTKRGVFYNIKKLNIGDIVKLESGNAELFEYRVVHKEEVPVTEVDMNKVLLSYDIDKQGLNLMTCGGEFDKKSSSYNKRTIVYAVRI